MWRLAQVLLVFFFTVANRDMPLLHNGLFPRKSINFGKPKGPLQTNFLCARNVSQVDMIMRWLSVLQLKPASWLPRGFWHRQIGAFHDSRSYIIHLNTSRKIGALQPGPKNLQGKCRRPPTQALCVSITPGHTGHHKLTYRILHSKLSELNLSSRTRYHENPSANWYQKFWFMPWMQTTPRCLPTRPLLCKQGYKQSEKQNDQELVKLCINWVSKLPT